MEYALFSRRNVQIQPKLTNRLRARVRPHVATPAGTGNGRRRNVVSSFIGCITLTLYPARHPLPSTTVRHDGRFRFSAGPRRQGQRGRRDAQHEEDLRAQGREGFLRPRPGCWLPPRYDSSRRGSVSRGSARRPVRARERRARVAANARPRARALSSRARVPFCPRLAAPVTAKRPSAQRRIFFAFRRRAIAWDRTSLSVSRVARDLRARRVARGDLTHGGSLAPTSSSRSRARGLRGRLGRPRAPGA